MFLAIAVHGQKREREIGDYIIAGVFLLVHRLIFDSDVTRRKVEHIQ